MNRNKATPKQDGYYLLSRAGEKDTIVKVYDINSGLIEYGAMIAFIGSDWDMSLCDALKKWKCSWSGQLLPPNSN